jgi:hypothetical protein
LEDLKATKNVVCSSEELESLMAFLPPAAGNQIWFVANKTGGEQEQGRG